MRNIGLARVVLLLCWFHPIYLYGLNVLCSYELTAMVQFALLMYMSEFWLRVSSFWLEETRIESLQRTEYLSVWVMDTCRLTTNSVSLLFCQRFRVTPRFCCLLGRSMLGYIYIYIYIYMCVYIYMYIYIKYAYTHTYYTYGRAPGNAASLGRRTRSRNKYIHLYIHM